MNPKKKHIKVKNKILFEYDPTLVKVKRIDVDLWEVEVIDYPQR